MVIKGLLYFGSCVARGDTQEATSALNSPGSFIRMVTILAMNFFLVVPVVHCCIGAFAAIFPASLVTVIFGLGICFVGLIVFNSMNTVMQLMVQYDLKVGEAYSYWWQIVAPHTITFTLLNFIAGLVIVPIASIIIFVVFLLLAYFEIPQMIQEQRIDGLVVGLWFASLMSILIYGLFGTYFAVLQGTCLHEMVKLWKKK